MITYEDMLRCQKFQIVPSMQPSHCTSMRWMKDRIGEHRTHRISRWKTFADLGLPIPGGSDCQLKMEIHSLNIMLQLQKGCEVSRGWVAP